MRGPSRVDGSDARTDMLACNTGACGGAHVGRGGPRWAACGRQREGVGPLRLATGARNELGTRACCTPKGVWGRPLARVLIAVEKGGSAVLVGAGAWLAFFVHGRVTDNPLWLLFPGEMSESPRDTLFRFLGNHIPTLGPGTVLGIGVFLVFYALLLAAESIGVWWDFAWGEALIILETLCFLPVEMYDISRHATAASFGSLGVNVLILWYVVRLYRFRQARRNAATGGDVAGRALLQVAAAGSGSGLIVLDARRRPGAETYSGLSREDGAASRGPDGGHSGGRHRVSGMEDVVDGD